MVTISLASQTKTIIYHDKNYYQIIAKKIIFNWHLLSAGHERANSFKCYLVQFHTLSSILNGIRNFVWCFLCLQKMFSKFFRMRSKTENNYLLMKIFVFVSFYLPIVIFFVPARTMLHFTVN